jgi:uncharacterized protein (TIGR03083 family)
MKPVEPIYTVELFPPISRELLSVLKSLSPADWSRPTICSPWSVKDVAAHLFGGNLSRLWLRDKSTTSVKSPIEDYADLLNLINHENENWIQAARRISPEILIELLDLTDRRLYEHFKGLAQDELAGITVAWASDFLAPNWFDIAREYTEKWLHQQHIRAAVGQPYLTARVWLTPVLDTFMRGLPRTFRSKDAASGTSISVQITGEAGGEWTLVKVGPSWELFVGRDPQAVCHVQLDQNLAWQLFTKGISMNTAKQQAKINGSSDLGEQVLKMVSIMA